MSRLKTSILFIVIILLSACNKLERNRPVTELPPSDSLFSRSKPEPVFMYGIPSDSFDIVNGNIKKNAFLSDILIKNGVSMPEIELALKNSKSVFDVRKVKSGNNYTLFRDRDSLAKLRYLVYEHDATTCYVFSFNDSLNITPFRKEIKREIRYATGIIQTSLWDAMIESELHPELVNKMADIFAWTVDFFALQKGDNFKVVYEALSIDDKALGVGRIYGAQFGWSGSAIYAIPFIQDSTESFFDADGNSLRKAFLKAPLQFSRISSRFSSSRLHPVLRIRRPHFGVDYAAALGTPVHAIGDGRVVYARTESGSGRIVRIQHNSVYATAYMHLSRFGPGISSGVHVSQGQIVGYVGSSGLSTGPHLDFRFYMNGSPVDPLKVESPPVEPIHEANKERFYKAKTVITDLLGTF